MVNANVVVGGQDHWVLSDIRPAAAVQSKLTTAYLRVVRLKELTTLPEACSAR